MRGTSDFSFIDYFRLRIIYSNSEKNGCIPSQVLIKTIVSFALSFHRLIFCHLHLGKQDNIFL
jgi:hypothetical protein